MSSWGKGTHKHSISSCLLYRTQHKKYSFLYTPTSEGGSIDSREMRPIVFTTTTPAAPDESEEPLYDSGKFLLFRLSLGFGLICSGLRRNLVSVCYLLVGCNNTISTEVSIITCHQLASIPTYLTAKCLPTRFSNLRALF